MSINGRGGEAHVHGSTSYSGPTGLMKLLGWETAQARQLSASIPYGT
jgi:hypothetical protein